MRFRRPESLNVILTGPKQVVVRPERLPRRRRGHTLLRATRTLVSTGTERRCFEGDFPPGSHWDLWVRHPFKLGYSFVGTTADGRRVCANAPHCQRVLVPDEEAFPVPDTVSDEAASWFALAAIAQHGIARAELQAGEPVVVVGAGVLGQLVAQLARVAGAGAVIVVARSRPRLDVALAHGATHVVGAGVADAGGAVLAHTGGEGAAVVFDVTGVESAFADSMKLARRRGTVVLLGDVGDPSGQRLGPELLNQDLSVVGAHIANTSVADKRRMAAGFLAAVENGSVSVDDLVTTRARPQDAPQIYPSLSDGDPTRLGVSFDWESVDFP